MLTMLRNNLLNRWGQIFHPKDPHAGLSQAEQAQLSWAKRVETYEAVPESFKDFFRPLQEAGCDLPYSVLTPSYEGFLHQAVERLVCDLGDEIHFLERSRKGYKDTCYPLDGISSLEYRKVLLDSHIRISGNTKQGEHESLTLRFNTVSECYFTPLMTKMRGGTPEASDPGVHPDREKFIAWMQVNYKFMMLGIRCLMAGEKVLQIHLQPEIRVPVLILFGKTFTRSVSPTHAIILTDREIITIQEDGWYGGIRNYLPLRKVESIVLNEKNKGLLEIRIQLKDEDRFVYLYPTSARGEVQEIVERCRELTGMA
jgi:hypothetical protein